MWWNPSYYRQLISHDSRLYKAWKEFYSCLHDCKPMKSYLRKNPKPKPGDPAVVPFHRLPFVETGVDDDFSFFFVKRHGFGGGDPFPC